MQEGSYCNSKIAALPLFLCALLLWLLNHPLHGIDYHDAIIYAVLALHWLTPDAYARDPFFMFGAQDGFSLFPAVQGWLVGHWGLTIAAVVILLSGAILWCMAAIWLARGLLRPAWLAATAVLATATLSLCYSSESAVFAINEGFATARSIAFPLGAMALAAGLQGRYRLASVCVGLSLLMHPLIGIWSLLVLVLLPISWRNRWLLMGGGCLLLLGAMLSDSSVFSRFDPAWEQLLRTYTTNVFVGPPDSLRWQAYSTQLLLLLIAAAYSERGNTAGQFYGVACLVAASGLLMATVGSYYWPSRIVIQAQLWRSMWLAVYLLPFACCHIFYLLSSALPPPLGKRPWLLIGVVAFLFGLRDNLWPVLLVALLYKFLPLSLRLQQRWSTLSALIQRHPFLPWVSVFAVLMAIPGAMADWHLLEGQVILPFELPIAGMAGLLVHGGQGLGFALLGCLLWRMGSSPYALGLNAALVLSLILALALAHWDMRTPVAKAWEARAAFGADDEIRTRIKPGEVVLWDRHMPMSTWYELRTAHYVSGIQAIGIVFSREKTYELASRAQRIRAAEAVERGVPAPTLDANGLALHPFAFTVPRGEGIRILCQDTALDWIISQQAVAYSQYAAAHVPNPYRSSEADILMFRCADLRKSGP